MLLAERGLVVASGGKQEYLRVVAAGRRDLPADRVHRHALRLIRQLRRDGDALTFIVDSCYLVAGRAGHEDTPLRIHVDLAACGSAVEVDRLDIGKSGDDAVDGYLRCLWRERHGRDIESELAVIGAISDVAKAERRGDSNLLHA